MNERSKVQSLNHSTESELCKANRMPSLFTNVPGQSRVWALFPGYQGLRFLPLSLDDLARVVSAALLWLIWRAPNYCNFGLCYQQPQRSPQAMTETLLAVAVHHSDGRMATLTLPLPSVCSLPSPCIVPAICPHEAEQLHQSHPSAALVLSTSVGSSLFLSLCLPSVSSLSL